jgi:hypothetical protein
VVSLQSRRTRGFCNKCGSALFWEPTPATHISISAGSLNPPTGLRIKEQIFLAQKGDYYELPAAGVSPLMTKEDPASP